MPAPGDGSVHVEKQRSSTRKQERPPTPTPSASSRSPSDHRNVRDRPAVAPLPRERLHSYANSEPTPHDGTHMTEFRDGVAAAVNAHLRKRRLLAETAPNLSTAQITHGLSGCCSTDLGGRES
ncbi:hypothetical protein [Streptomyces sp. NPDC056361]|uniref:hypothetical protein n=1 Tax=Streptomyces sp. NPDC056361 TaxID=3345795 RepID=UPI0035D5DF14